MTYFKRGKEVEAGGRKGKVFSVTFKGNEVDWVVVEHNDDPVYKVERVAYSPKTVKEI